MKSIIVQSVSAIPAAIINVLLSKYITSEFGVSNFLPIFILIIWASFFILLNSYNKGEFNLNFKLNKEFKKNVYIISIILGIFILLIAPYYISQCLILLLIPAFCLIFSIENVKINRIILFITLFLSIFFFFFIISKNTISNPYNAIMGMYYAGQLTAMPNIVDVNTYVIGYEMLLVYSVYNLFFSSLFFIKSLNNK